MKADFELPVPDYKSVRLNQTTQEAHGLENENFGSRKSRGHPMMIDGNYN